MFAPPLGNAVKEVVLRFFFQGHATVRELARDVAGSVSRQEPHGGPAVSRHRIEDMAVEFDLRPEHVVQLIDEVARGELSLEDLDAICFCLEASDRFVWDGDTPEGERVAEALFWLGTPEINYPLAPGVLAKVRHYLLTGENTLTRDDSRIPPETA